MRLHGFAAFIFAVFVLSPASRAQEIVSAQSGVIHFTEGTVLVDNVPLDRKPATFPLLKDGSVLSTQKGRAELMLTPGTFLRLDENSSVKMLSSNLTATRLEFIAGSVILDATGAQGDVPLVLEFKDATISFPKPGLYRIDSDTGVLQAYEGEALVKQNEKEKRVDSARLYFFELGTDTKKFSDGTDDEFLDWARDRNQVIEQENQTAQADADQDADADLSAPSPFNFNVPYNNLPYGNLNVTPAVPGYGTLYPYNDLFYSNYAMSPFWLPPLIGPAIIIGRPWVYRGVSPKSPHSGSWASRHPSSASAGWLASHPIGVYPRVGSTYTHPMTTVPHPLTAHPVVVPHVSAPAVHVVGHH